MSHIRIRVGLLAVPVALSMRTPQTDTASVRRRAQPAPVLRLAAAVTGLYARSLSRAQLFLTSMAFAALDGVLGGIGRPTETRRGYIVSCLDAPRKPAAGSPVVGCACESGTEL